MQKTTFGGERLGAGGKMKVDLKSYERSTHDLGFIWRSTMGPGTLVPFMVEPALPGDTFDIDLNCDVKTHPTLGPLFGSFKAQLDIFEIPARLYQSALMQNMTTIGNSMQNIILPQLRSDPITQTALSATNQPDNTQINPSSLLSYLGIRGWGLNLLVASPTRTMNAIPFLGYWEIYKNYYANKQELAGQYLIPPPGGSTTITTITIGAGQVTVNGNLPPGLLLSNNAFLINFTATAPTLTQLIFHTSDGDVLASTLATWSAGAGVLTAIPGTYPPNLYIYGWSYANPLQLISIGSFNLTNIDTLKSSILASGPILTTFTVTSATADPYGKSIALGNTPFSQCGLALKTYQSDLFNNWMQTTWYTSIQNASAVSTVGNTFNVDALILARKVYDLLNRIAVSGGTYHDWINAVYDHEAYTICNTPIYHGGLSKEVIFQQVVSNSTTPSQPLGTLAGKGGMGQKHKGGKVRIKIHEPGYIMGIVSLTPRIDYSQGNKWHTYGIVTMTDFHKPGLDQIGFQQLITEQMAWWDTHYNGTTFVQNSVGFQPAWVNYMTNVNQNYGNFAIANNEMFMTLNRRYQQNTGTGFITDLTTYIDPSHYNFIFAQTNLDAQNFWVQIAVDNTARRKMSAKIMPNL